MNVTFGSEVSGVVERTMNGREKGIVIANVTKL
jgi:hypothetical protein